MASPSLASSGPEDTLSTSSLDVDYPKLLCKSPVPYDRVPSAWLSPPLSRASSPLPPHLTDIAPSPRANAIVPLPSPVTNPETRPIGKKTSAFFSSPFDRDAPSPPRFLSRRASNSSTNPSSPSQSSIEPVIPLPERAQTANPSFFVKGSATPTPPPSVHSSDDGPTSLPPPPPKLPPLSRFFPSRHTIDRDPDLSDDSGSLGSPLSLHVSLQRDFVAIDQLPSFSSSPTDLTFPDSPTPKSEAPPSLDHRQPPPLHRETVPADKLEFTQETILGTDVPLQLIRELGQGAFSSVWLALDVEHKLEQPGLGSRLKSESIARRKGDRSVHGLRPPPSTPGSSITRNLSVYFAAQDGEGATSPGEADAKDNGTGDRTGTNLVAVKMIDRSACDADDRTRISFVREVEVLRVSIHLVRLARCSWLFCITSTFHIRRLCRICTRLRLPRITASCWKHCRVASCLNSWIKVIIIAA